jgi:hypothetical protein
MREMRELRLTGGGSWAPDGADREAAREESRRCVFSSGDPTEAFHLHPTTRPRPPDILLITITPLIMLILFVARLTAGAGKG